MRGLFEAATASERVRLAGNPGTRVGDCQAQATYSTARVQGATTATQWPRPGANCVE